MDDTKLNTKGGTRLSDKVAYDDWEFETKAELRRRGVLDITLGTETRPLGSANSKAVKAWITKRDVATATIIGRLDISPKFSGVWWMGCWDGGLIWIETVSHSDKRSSPRNIRFWAVLWVLAPTFRYCRVVAFLGGVVTFWRAVVVLSGIFAHFRDFEEDPAGMWERLRETHQSSGLGGVVVAWKRFYALRKSGDHSTMRAHIAAVRGHAEKLGLWGHCPLRGWRLV
ncbi:hypothetical protein DFH06DRAFT_1400077 [Mycena polygramma]|nr:hypothetical protein DFH06DRAFT_1400077 [Mycena polygramma]